MMEWLCLTKHLIMNPSRLLYFHERRFVLVVVLNYKLSNDELLYRQALPLSIKERMSITRIRDFLNEFGDDGVYISFSGGKDSTVLLDLVRKVSPNVEAVFLDTWMEYPQVRQFVKGYENVKVIKPEKSMKQIIEEDGWCFPSKDVAEAVEAYRRGIKWAQNKLNGLDKDGKPSEYRQQYKKWLNLAENCPEKISQFCCLDMKERPVEKYERRTGKKPILALMASESARRKDAYLKTGCNSFDGSRPMSKPIAFWVENDILEYCFKNDIKIAEPYGKIEKYEQLTMFSDCSKCSYKTTGESRTGCMFCPVGMHLDKYQKFKRLKKYNEDLYDYVMEELGLIKLIEWVQRNY